MLLADHSTIADIRPLRAHCTGDVVVPGERVWAEVLAGWGELDAGSEPAAVVFAASEYDVVAVLAYVRYAGLNAVLEGSPEAGDLPDDLGATVLVHGSQATPPWAC
jgi:hypothetical protein